MADMRRMTLIVLLLTALLFSEAAASGDDFERYKASFKNFVTCELTRTDATDHFKGAPFTITMVSLHSVTRESGLTILKGAVKCHVKDRYVTLYPAIGVETVVDKKQVTYYTIRREDFSILASELFRFPYNERCPWTRYWINLD
jgi:hypothetical protein